MKQSAAAQRLVVNESAPQPRTWQRSFQLCCERAILIISQAAYPMNLYATQVVPRDWHADEWQL